MFPCGCAGVGLARISSSRVTLLLALYESRDSIEAAGSVNAGRQCRIYLLQHRTAAVKIRRFHAWPVTCPGERRSAGSIRAARNSANYRTSRDGANCCAKRLAEGEPTVLLVEIEIPSTSGNHYRMGPVVRSQFR
jgi:hypothetical protein